MSKKTPVIFRKWQNGDIIALFPTLPGDMDPSTCSSYMHTGQHSAANYNLMMRITKPASQYEWTPLFIELERVGYDLVVKKRQSQEMIQQRLDEIRRITKGENQ